MQTRFMDVAAGHPRATALQVTLGNWRTAPFNQWGFRNVRSLVPTANISAGRNASALPAAPRSLGAIAFKDRFGVDQEVEQVLASTHTDGFIVVQDATIIEERYLNGLTPDCPHILMSVAKSLTACLAAAISDRGWLDFAAGVVEFVPEVEGTAYEDATIQHLLDMSAGVDFDEDYGATEGPMITYRQSTGWNPPSDDADAPSDLRTFLLTLRKARQHGGHFQYTSPNTDLLAWVIERAARMPFGDAMSAYIWQPMGAEFDAYLTVDSLGAARPAGGICTTLRDLARVGQMMLSNGVANGNQVVPAWFIQDTLNSGDTNAWAAGTFKFLLPGGAYRNKWYLCNDGLGAFLGFGIHGQFLYIAPGARTVIARFGSHPTPIDDADCVRLIDAFAAVADALRG
jgi:CubicO group peptidase (beta-lactamase class C family)